MILLVVIGMVVIYLAFSFFKKPAVVAVPARPYAGPALLHADKAAILRSITTNPGVPIIVPVTLP